MAPSHSPAPPPPHHMSLFSTGHTDRLISCYNAVTSLPLVECCLSVMMMKNRWKVFSVVSDIYLLAHEWTDGDPGWTEKQVFMFISPLITAEISLYVCVCACDTLKYFQSVYWFPSQCVMITAELSDPLVRHWSYCINWLASLRRNNYTCIHA